MNKELNIGDYVRTKEFGIQKIEWFDNGEPILENGFTALQSSGYESDTNIIRLLKKGDYINGYPIQFTLNDKEVVYNENHPNTLNCLAEDIKSIVTKEQFEAMKYEIK